MQFRTELQPDRLPVSIRLDSRLVTSGSCFAEVMGSRLARCKVEVLNNPFGTIFNPISIARVLLAALNGEAPNSDLYLERDGLWFHHDFHSSFWAESRDQLRELLTQRLSETGEALRRADWLLLTFGTSVVYRHLETGNVVANCHKLPGSLFEKYLYQIDHLVEAMSNLIKHLHRVNPDLRILVSISPVRHIKDTLLLNQVSKSTLRLLCHELVVRHSIVQYFPAYEIMLDDLRDYRFYEADMIHPNAQAKEYIFEKFAESCFDNELCAFVTEWQGVQKALAHRPFCKDSESYRRFLENLLKQLDLIAQKVDVQAEREEILSRLAGRLSWPR